MQEQVVWCFGVIEAGGEVNAKDVRDALAKFDKSRPVTLRVNSPGGSVHEAIAIRSLLSSWPGGVQCQVDGLSASAASFLMTVAKTVAIVEFGSVMIHDCWGATVGNAADHTSTAEVLDQISDTIAMAYSQKTGKSQKVIRDAMRRETWYTSRGSVEFGLCDVVVGENGAVAAMTTTAARAKLDALQRQLDEAAALIR